MKWLGEVICRQNATDSEAAETSSSGESGGQATEKTDVSFGLDI